jgi:hypothetical protein
MPYIFLVFISVVTKDITSSVEVGRNLFPHDYNMAPGGVPSQEEIFHHESFTIKERENGCEFSVQTLDKTGSDMLKF